MFELLKTHDFAVAINASHAISRALVHGRLQTLELDEQAADLARTILREIERAESAVLSEVSMLRRREYVTQLGEFLCQLLRPLTELVDAEQAIQKLRKVEVPYN